MALGENKLFNFSSEQLNYLRDILGNSGRAHNFISYAETVIDVTLMERQYTKIKLTASARNKKLANIKKKSEALSRLIEDISFEFGITYSEEEFSNFDYETRTAIEASWVERPEKRGFAKDNFVHELFLGLKELEIRCETTIEYEKKSKTYRSLSWEQRLHNQFDRNVIFDYRATWSAFPATTDDGAFCKAMVMFYGAAHFPSRNIQERVINEIKRQREMLRDPQAFPAIPNLHPDNETEPD